MPKGHMVTIDEGWSSLLSDRSPPYGFLGPGTLARVANLRKGECFVSAAGAAGSVIVGEARQVNVSIAVEQGNQQCQEEDEK
jgi:hypothetical protein